MNIISEKLEDIRNYLDAEVHPIITLLKEQEPRVMTLEQVRLAYEVWLETRGWVDGDIFETVQHVKDSFHDCVIEFKDKTGLEIVCESDEYEIYWRCWTSEPTKEQMEATSWNE